MKLVQLVIGLAIVGALGVAGNSSGGSSQTGTPATTPAHATPTQPHSAARDKSTSAYPKVGVEQLAKNPAAFRGRTFVLRGVVSGVVSKRRLFTLIDQKEYDSCRELGCSAYVVPVMFSGTLPDTAKSVLVTGRLEQPERGRYLVQASQVELVR